jgi:hypothetical protein
MRKDWKRCSIGIAALALGVVSAPASAHCDFFTGGGFVITTAGGSHPPAKGTFGVGGGCKHGHYWGHLEYHDHGNGLNVHWLTITGYLIGETIGDEKDPKRQGRRHVCGTARTNLAPPHDEVDFRVEVFDRGEPGVDDTFIIRLGESGALVYTNQGPGDVDVTLGGDGPGGGNIQLHKPNPSTTGESGGDCRI